MSKIFTILTSLVLCIAIFVACGPKKNNSENTEPKSESVERSEPLKDDSGERSSENGTFSESEESVESEESTETEKNSDSSGDKDSEVDYDDDKYWTNFY